MIWGWFRRSGECNVPHMIAADISCDQWTCVTTYLEGFVWNPPVFRLLQCFSLNRGPKMATTLRLFRAECHFVTFWLTAATRVIDSQELCVMMLLDAHPRLKCGRNQNPDHKVPTMLHWVLSSLFFPPFLCVFQRNLNQRQKTNNNNKNNKKQRIVCERSKWSPSEEQTLI